MKRLWLLAGLLLFCRPMAAQTNQPIRLAIVAETGPTFEPGLPPLVQGLMGKFGVTSDAADLLTAQLSTRPNIQLLERDEIEKVYHEQGLSAQNRNDIKLGQILGADGVLFLRLTHGEFSHLSIRLVAVKPGAVVLAETFTGSPRLTLPDWASAFATSLEPFLPKLAVVGKDAIPISVVNFRDAVRSPEAAEMERQLRLLAIERLSQEQRLFVLERREMGMMSEEKDLKLDDSPFWSGRYLLEGVVDQNGYSTDILTLDARLTPARGGAPVLMQVSGSRTNLTEVLNRLAAKINAALKLGSMVPDWKPGEEAAQYFEEAKWALRWGMISEAQTASDSAWALGKRDLACATVRVKSYSVPPDKGAVETIQWGFTGPIKDSMVRSRFRDLFSNHVAVTYQRISRTVVRICAAKQPLDAGNVDQAAQDLNLYLQYSQTLPPTEPQVNSEWYRLGIENLTTASEILQQFYVFPQFRDPAADKLAALRALARAVAERILKSSSVQDSYFIRDQPGEMGDRDHKRDLAYTLIDEKPNIFKSEINYGSLWQETPEDCVGLYKPLMRSPVFSYLQGRFWHRGERLTAPRFIVWTDDAKKRATTAENELIDQLETSSNLVGRLEGKALRVVDAPDEATLGAAYTNLFASVFEDRQALIADPVALTYLDLGKGELLLEQPESPTRTLLGELYKTNYSRQWGEMAAESEFFPFFRAQKKFLIEKKPFDIGEFGESFSRKNYSPLQAREILPLIASYRSNIAAQVETLSGIPQMHAQGALFFIKTVEDSAKNVLNPPPPRPPIARDPSRQYSPPGMMGDPRQSGSFAGSHALPTGPVLLVTNYWAFPRDQFCVPPLSAPRCANQRWSQGQLLLDLHYNIPRHADTWLNGPPDSRIATVIFNPTNGAWNILEHPMDATNAPIPRFAAFFDRNRSGRRFELFHGSLYLGEDRRFKRCDPATKHCENLPIPCQTNSELFTIDDHLYAADSESISEITDEGRATRLLASTRRRPTVSVLDSLDDLGSPVLFANAGHSLCASVGNKVFSWTGQNWHDLFTLEFSLPPQVSSDAVIFRHLYPVGPNLLWIWNKGNAAPELALSESPVQMRGAMPNRWRQASPPAQPLWTSPEGYSLVNAPATFVRSNLCFLVDERDGSHGELFCFSRERTDPVIVPLKFDSDRGEPPLRSRGGGRRFDPSIALVQWISVAGDTLYLGQSNDAGFWTLPVSDLEARLTAKNNP